MCSANVLCPLCSHSSFQNIHSLRISLIKVANGPIACPQCSAIFLGLDKLTIHLFSHLNLITSDQFDPKNAKPNVSEQNSVSGTFLSAVNQNEENAKLPELRIDNLPKCDICDLTFRSDELLKMHYKLKHQDLMAITDSSNTIAVETDELIDTSYFIDILNTNSSAAVAPLADDMPIELISSTKDIKLNESTKIWECDICAKAFTTKYFLKKHKRLHTGEMPYSCEICGRTFTFQQSYHKHLLYHSDEKPHVCQTCHRAFKELSTLHNHERIHSGEKPFKCEICGKSFRQRVSFLVHTRIHTGVMPYKCSVCQKSFRYKLSLRTHKCLQLSTEPEKNSLQSMIKSSTVTASIEGHIGIASTRNVTMIDNDVASNEKAYELHNHFVSKSIDELIVESCNNMEMGSDLQNFNGSMANTESTTQECTHCPSVKFQNLHLYTPITEESSIDQFLYDIENSYL